MVGWAGHCRNTMPWHIAILAEGVSLQSCFRVGVGVQWECLLLGETVAMLPCPPQSQRLERGCGAVKPRNETG